jgi:hypothetical protein
MVEIPSEDEMLEILNSFDEVEGQPIDIMTSGHVFKQNPDVGTDIRIGEQVDLWIYSVDEEDSMRIAEEWEEREAKAFDEDDTDD